jgi:hypothetical protein
MLSNSHYIIGAYIYRWILKRIRQKLFFLLSAEKIIVIAEHDKNIRGLITFIFYHKAVVKQDQYMTIL